MSAIPCHVAFIMDGNGRWAVKRGLSRLKGHREAKIEELKKQDEKAFVAQETEEKAEAESEEKAE